MISVSSTLQSVCRQSSRSPIASVYVETPMSFTELVDLRGASTSYEVYKVVTGDGYWMAFARQRNVSVTPPTSSSWIYYNKITDITSSSDWNSGWTQLANVGSAPGVYPSYMDAWCDGADHVLVAYNYNPSGTSQVNFIETGNAGSSWSSAAQVGTDTNTKAITIGDDERIFYQDTNWKIKTAYRTYSSPGDSWTVGSVWPYGGDYWWPAGLDAVSFDEPDTDSEHYFMTMGWVHRGDLLSSDYTSAIVEIFSDHSYQSIIDWGPVVQTMGQEQTITANYRILSLSKEPIGDYYFGLVTEKYITALDLETQNQSDMVYAGRTKDFLNYSPLALPPEMDHLGETAWPMIPGVLYDDDYLVLVTTGMDLKTVVYTSQKASWWGFDQTTVGLDISDDVTDQININYNAGQAASASLTLSNANFQYSNSDIIKPGSIIKINTGYRHTVGNPVANASFEHPTPLAGWSQSTAGSDYLSVTLSQAHYGRKSALMISVDGGGNSYIRENPYLVGSGVQREISWYAKASSESANPSYAIYDITNSDWIVSKTSYSGLSMKYWKKMSVLYTPPDNCAQIWIYFYTSTIAGITYIDDVKESIYEEFQQRFIGPIINVEEVYGIPRQLNIQAADMYYKATAPKSHRAALLTGTNVLHVDFKDVLDTDYFVPSGGTWAIENIYNPETQEDDIPALTQSAKEKAYTIAGMDINNSRTAIVHMQSIDEIDDNKFGIAIQIDSMEEGETTNGYVVIYNDTSGEIELSSFTETEDTITLSVQKTTSLSLSWSADTDYWLMVRWMYGSVSVWYSTDGEEWTNAWTDEVLSGVGIDGYVGLYCEIDSARSDDTKIAYLDALFLSGEPPMSSSDAVNGLATMAGLTTVEHGSSVDLFDYTASTTADIIDRDEWIATLGPGYWSTTSDRLKYAPSGSSSNASLLGSVSGHDIIASAFLKRDTTNSGSIGLCIRTSLNGRSGYIGLITQTYVYIAKRTSVSGSITGGELFRVSIPSNLKQWVKMTFMARGNCLALFLDDVLIGAVTDDSFSDGYAGVQCNDGYGYIPGQPCAAWFKVGSLYAPEDVVTLRPGDTIASVIAQILAKYPNGGAFCDYLGRLRFGTFDKDKNNYFDAEGIMTASTRSRVSDKTINIARIVGNMAQGEYRNLQSISDLGMIKFQLSEDKSISSGPSAFLAAFAAVVNTLISTERTLSIFGQPAMEQYDTIRIPDETTDSWILARILSYSETIGPIYEQAITEMDDHTFVPGTLEVISGEHSNVEDTITSFGPTNISPGEDVSTSETVTVSIS